MVTTKEEFDIEEPILNLNSSTHDNLPEEIPDVFGSDKPQSKKEDNILLLLKDVEIYLQIGDVVRAKEIYQQAKIKYTKLSPDEQKTHYDKIRQVYKQLNKYNSFGSKLKRMFSSSKKKNKVAPKEEKK